MARNFFPSCCMAVALTGLLAAGAWAQTVPAPALPPLPAPPAAPVFPPAAAVKPPPAAAVSVGLAGARIGSVLFRPDDMEKLRKALDLYSQSQIYGRNGPQTDESQEEDDFLSKLEESQRAQLGPGETVAATPPKMQETWPVVTLNSIMYHSEKDWVVWISGRKIESKKPADAEVEIIAVEPRRVTLAWTPGSRLRAAQEKIGQLPPEKTQWIGFDSTKNRYVVHLFPNQSFVTETMEVMEGKPAVAEKKKGDGKTDEAAPGAATIPPPPVALPAATAGPSVADAAREAIKSLTKQPTLMNPNAPTR